MGVKQNLKQCPTHFPKLQHKVKRTHVSLNKAMGFHKVLMLQDPEDKDNFRGLKVS